MLLVLPKDQKGTVNFPQCGLSEYADEGVQSIQTAPSNLFLLANKGLHK